MVERNILAYNKDEKVYSWGAKADEIEVYREWLARSL
jgi:hypothetical protein